MDGQQAVVLILRLLHVVGGVFWVGAMTVLAWFLFPAVRAAGPEGGKVMQQVMAGRNLSRWMGTAALLTVGSGLILFGWFARVSRGAWIRTPAAHGYSFGAVVALVALGIGLGVGMRSMMRVQRIAREAALVGGAPTAEQAAEMQRLQARAAGAAKVASALLLLATAVMGTARYF
jgi:hypothetical protein